MTILGLSSIVLLLFISNIYWGSISIPFPETTNILLGKGDKSAWQFIILHSRIPAAITAVLTGAALGVCGLLLQSFFRNPLAGPSIFGITSGANLAVAINILAFGAVSVFALTFSALAGSFFILLLLLILSKIVKDPIILLIVGILVSYLTNAIITLLGYTASADGAQSLLLWGMGSFNSVGLNQMPFFALIIIIGLILSVFLVKPLNGWMLGEDYAENLGINISKTRILTLLTTGLLAAITTAYCGPISFVGLSVPHIARLLTRTDNHRILIPVSALTGALCTSFCLLISTSMSDGRLLPINALTPIFGIPVIIYVLLSKK